MMNASVIWTRNVVRRSQPEVKSQPWAGSFLKRVGIVSDREPIGVPDHPH